MSSPRPSKIEAGLHLLGGLCMGGADVIPGVSGGTVALILGIYQRLVTAISRFDTHLLNLLRKRKWQEAIAHVDLAFLLSLALGIGLGILTMGRLADHLLSDAGTRPPTWAAFFGMIAGSTLLVARYVQVDAARQKIIAFTLALVGVGTAYYLTTWQLGAAELEPGYLFVCGMIGICAMILPGISGAYLLLVLGVYGDLTDLIKRLPSDLVHGKVATQDLVHVGLFGLGCLVGLLAFSKVLRWLLSHYQPFTMATMCGFMVGALPKLWPFQHDLTPGEEEFKHKLFEPIWPTALDRQALLCLATAVAGFLVVLAADRLTLGRKSADEMAGEEKRL